MKFKLTMKDADTLEASIRHAVVGIEHTGTLTGKELDKIEELKSLCRTWLRYGEYLTVEIDTEAKTCVVMPVEK